MNPLITFCLGAWLVLSCASRSFCVAGGDERASVKESLNNSRPEPVVHDDLGWLVGRWWCVKKEWLDPSKRLNGSRGGEHLLEWFNVYFPFADESLTLKLSRDPEQRAIAAEFVIRGDPNDYYGEKGLGLMEPSSIVRIGTSAIRVGKTFNQFEFKYWRTNEMSKPTLVLESKHMRLHMEKVCDRPGRIEESWVVAPIRNYSREQRDLLRARYDRLRDLNKTRTSERGN